MSAEPKGACKVEKRSKPKRDKKTLNGPQYFYEDEVCRTTKSGEVEFGMVMENWEMYASDDEEDDSDMSRVPRGHVSVNWHPKGKEETVREAKVRLSDRSLMPGDVVRRQRGADMQRGYCRSVKVRAAAQVVGTKKIIPNILASNVRQLQNLQPDVAVYLDSWVGVIRDVHSTITLRLPDKSQCTIDSQRLVDVFEDTRRSDLGFNSSDIFYPGQRLRGPLKRLKESKFINASEEGTRSKDNKNVIVTVLKIEPVAVTVQWQWQAPATLHSFKTTSPTATRSKSEANLTEHPDLDFVLNPSLPSAQEVQKIHDQVCQGLQGLGIGGRNIVNSAAIRTVLQTISNCIKLDAGRGSNTNLAAQRNSPAKSASTSTSAIDVNVKLVAEKQTSSSGDVPGPQDHVPQLQNDGISVSSASTGVNQDGEEGTKTDDDQNTKSADKPYEVEIKIEKMKSPKHTQPTEFITGEALKRLKCLNLFDACTVQLGDFSFYVPTASDREAILERSVWRKVVAAGHDVLELVPATKSLSLLDAADSSNTCFEETEEDDASDDDEAEQVGLKGAKRKKHTAPRVCTKELRKKKLKKSKPRPVVHFSPGSEVVIETVHTSSFVDVVWQDGVIEEGIRSVDLYPIHHLDDHEFFPGDFVVRAGTSASSFDKVYGVVQTVDHCGRVALVQWFDPNPFLQDLTVPLQPKKLEVEEMSVYDLRDHTEYKFRPGTIVIRIGNILPEDAAAGQVVDNYPDGQVRVWWATTGETLPCWPQEIYRLADYDSDEGEVWNDQGSDSSWETETDEEEIEKFEKKKTGADEAKDTEDDATAATEEKTLTDSFKQETPVVITPAAGVTKTFSDPYFKIASAERFALVEIRPDLHHYGSSSFEAQNSKSFLKVVQKEIQLFRENLPSGIYVKGYEDRMDLYSVMICGPENTPYEDGLFLFDVQLPPNYPHSPPLVFYNSFCDDRLNPNLYECGKVCVSLLGTWSGKGSEVWSSTDSSLLQLFVSIQGLILVPEPYYNEAGYEKQKGTDQGKENSRMYNEMVLIKLVQSMSRQLLRPVFPWEEEIKLHIHEHGPRLIKRLRSWLKQSDQARTGTSQTVTAVAHDVEHEGAVDANAIGENAKVPGFSLLPVSKGFSITLKKALDDFAKLCDQPEPSSSSSSTKIQSVDSLD